VSEELVRDASRHELTHTVGQTYRPHTTITRLLWSVALLALHHTVWSGRQGWKKS